jgi:geranylgeranyl diphosphate synthase type II
VTCGRASAAGRVAELSALVEAELARALDASSADEEASGAARLAESMRYSLCTPGKRLRPLLVLTGAEAVGADGAPLARFAAGVEMIHAYSLIHDDLPAMDDDDLRRGQPTNHVVYGDGLAILAGDALLTEAFVAMLEPLRIGGIEVEPSRHMRVVRDVAVAAGMAGMVGGQAADLMAEGQVPEESLLRSIHERKTGALIRASVLAGASLPGGSEQSLAALGRFAVHYGLAFQIADDIKDEAAPSAVTGKRTGGDREADKMTYPALLGVDGSRARLQAELDAALDALTPLSASADALAALARGSLAPALVAS